MSDRLLRSRSFSGKQLRAVQTNVKLDQTYVQLKTLGCSDTLILSVMSVMSIEQPWFEFGRLYGFKSYNNNYGGIDLTSGNWSFNQRIHAGYIVLTEGGTNSQKAYAAFKSLRAGLEFKVTQLRNKGFDEAGRSVDSFAQAYYTKWNGLGFRSLKKFDYIRQTPVGRIEQQQNKYPSSIWSVADAEALALARNAYIRMEKIIAQLKTAALPAPDQILANFEPVSEPFLQSYIPITPSESPAESTIAISPFIHSLESFHPKIQYELTRRRVASETANVYMPFVKLTSLVEVTSSNLPDGEGAAYCPSLGIHGQDKPSFLARSSNDNIYLPQSDSKSTIGYAISNDGNNTVPVIVADASKDAKNIPIPGITQITAERGTAGPMGVRGGLLRADLKIVAYSVGQVDTLLKYFLRPATRVVLELGRLSSNKNEKKIQPYNWKQPKTTHAEYFSELILNAERQKEFIKQYMYDNYGNYEIFIAYVVKFNLKYNKNNTYEIDLTLHSVQQFEVPTKHTAVKSTCPDATNKCSVIDVHEYFSDMSSWKTNSFNQLISYYLNDTNWRNQIVPIRNSEVNSVGAGGDQAGTRENEYFVSWRFFVEKILGDKILGIASMLGDTDKIVADLSLVRPVKEPSGSLSDKGLISNQVGYHPNLRSTNPGVMIIHNAFAQQKYLNSSDQNKFQSVVRLAELSESEPPRVSILENNTLYQTLTSVSPAFENTLSPNSNDKAGASFLTRGIWLNTKAIKQAFTSTDTISSGINNLLSMMNMATEGYWNLQLYSTDVENPGFHVIDMGLSKEPKISTIIDDIEEIEDVTDILQSIRDAENGWKRYGTDDPKFIYVFNRKTVSSPDGDLGSDLIDLNVEFNMPQVIAVQAIANIGGPAQKSTLQSINVDELKQISLIKNLFSECNESDICTENLSCDNDPIKNLRDEINRVQQELSKQQQGLTTLQTSLAGEEFKYYRERGEVDINLQIGQLQRELKFAQDTLNVEEAKIQLANPNLIGTLREYADLGTALELIEINPSRMIKLLNIDSTNIESGRESPLAHAFNSSNLTKTIVDVTLPGIGGISLFQSFLVDRVPSILERGFYVVTKITHEFSSQNGWITKIQGRFRYRPTKQTTTTGRRPYNLCTQTQ